MTAVIRFDVVGNPAEENARLRELVDILSKENSKLRQALQDIAKLCERPSDLSPLKGVSVAWLFQRWESISDIAAAITPGVRSSHT